MTKPAIGFIGLGLMGAAMVERLQSLGYQVTALANTNRTGIDAAGGRTSSKCESGCAEKRAADEFHVCFPCVMPALLGISRRIGNRDRLPRHRSRRTAIAPRFAFRAHRGHPARSSQGKTR